MVVMGLAEVGRAEYDICPGGRLLWRSWQPALLYDLKAYMLTLINTILVGIWDGSRQPVIYTSSATLYLANMLKLLVNKHNEQQQYQPEMYPLSLRHVSIRYFPRGPTDYPWIAVLDPVRVGDAGLCIEPSSSVFKKLVTLTRPRSLPAASAYSAIRDVPLFIQLHATKIRFFSSGRLRWCDDDNKATEISLLWRQFDSPARHRHDR